MKCIDKKIKWMIGAVLIGAALNGCAKQEDLIIPYEKETYSSSLYQGTLYATNLCVAAGDRNEIGIAEDSSLHGEAIFRVNQMQIPFAYNLHEQIYPASTTKILTALTALKHGNPEDIVTVGSKATTELDKESSVAGLKLGDQLSLLDLLYGLMLPSGNDCGVAIAEHIAGTEEAFVELMNQEAMSIGATNSHFTNSHGLQDNNHYTTVYDLYLMFQEALKDERFAAIVEAKSYKPDITASDGTKRVGIEWTPTNYYDAGKKEVPGNVTLIGGKTGTTNEAGSCLVFLEKDASGNPYITIVMGADTKDALYKNMTKLIEAI